jgi:hypothetical protein
MMLDIWRSKWTESRGEYRAKKWTYSKAKGAHGWDRNDEGKSKDKAQLEEK